MAGQSQCSARQRMVAQTLNLHHPWMKAVQTPSSVLGWMADRMQKLRHLGRMPGQTQAAMVCRKQKPGRMLTAEQLLGRMQVCQKRSLVIPY